MDNKEKINRILESLDQLKPAEPNAFLYAKIITKINAAREEYTPVKLVWLAAASFAILIALNLQVMKSLPADHRNEPPATCDLVNDFHLLNTSTINYNE